MVTISDIVLLLVGIGLAVAAPIIVQIGANRGSFGRAWPKHGFWNF